MPCPICDQKPMNCDCTETERRQYAEIEELQEQVASLRLTDAEREAIERGIDSLLGVEDMSAGAGTDDDAAACLLRSLLDRLV